MTKLQRKKHVAALKACVQRRGYTQDRYGNFVKRRQMGLAAGSVEIRRYKFTARALRHELFSGGRWVNVVSGYYADVSIDSDDLIHFGP